MKGKLILAAALLAGFLASPAAALATTYYVSSSGSGSNNGTSPNTPWPIDKVNKNSGVTFNPGDQILFKKGDSFTVHLQITQSGAAGNPIVYGAYGEGAAPILQNPGGQWNHPITLLANYITIQDLHLTNAGDAGICIDSCSSGRAGTASYNLIQRLEIDNTGTGLRIYGHHNKILNNKIHDLKMIVNTSGGDDDWGATGIFFYNGDNEAAYNDIYNCNADSYDYGKDGGAFEVAAKDFNANNLNIHHNLSRDNKGFMEIGGNNSGKSTNNNIIAYNFTKNDGRSIGTHLSGGFGVNMTGLRIENNTFVGSGTSIVFWGTQPNAQTFAGIKNNIFSGFSTPAPNIAPHSNNLYSTTPSSGYSLGSGDKVGNPQFVSSSDYHLQSISPAINSGANLGYTQDVDGNPISGLPDMGAYEYQGSGGGAPPTPSPTPSPGVSPSPSPSASPAAKPGDASGDNRVDGLDYVIWLNHFGQTVSGAGNGDFDNNNHVDGVDYVIWLNHYEG